MKRQKYINDCLNGNTDAIRYMLKNEPTKFINYDSFLELCLNSACVGAHYNIVDIILQHKNVTSYYTLQHACEGGNEAIIDKISKYRENDPEFKVNKIKEWKNGAYGACAGGQLEIFLNILKLYLNGESFVNVLKLHQNGEEIFFFWDNCLKHATKNHKPNFKVANFIVDNYLYNNKNKNKNKMCGLSSTINPHFLCVNDLLVYTCRMGRLDYVNLIVKEEGVYHWNRGLWGACFKGCPEIVELMITKGATDFNDGLVAACEGGSLEIAKLMIEKGVQQWYNALRYACIGNHFEIVVLIIQNCTDLERNLNDILWCACVHSNIEIIKLIIVSGASNFNDGLRYACKYGRIDSAILMIEYGATNLNECMDYSYDVVILQLLINKGASDLSYLKDTTDFKLYCMYCLYAGDVNSNNNNVTYVNLLQEYPPYVLFVISRVNKNCSVKKLPVELFRLLMEYC